MQFQFLDLSNKIAVLVTLIWNKTIYIFMFSFISEMSAATRSIDIRMIINTEFMLVLRFCFNFKLNCNECISIVNKNSNGKCWELNF